MGCGFPFPGLLTLSMLPVSSATRALMRATRDSMAAYPVSAFLAQSESRVSRPVLALFPAGVIVRVLSAATLALVLSLALGGGALRVPADLSPAVLHGDDRPGA